MKTHSIICSLMFGLLAAAMPAAEPRNAVSFHWFEYSGSPTIGAPEPAENQYRNPILAGFYPDPSICRVGDDFYLVNSTFSWWPGIPVFHSRDLVHWEQIGSVITRHSQADFRGLAVSRGVFAPSIRYHNGLFYVVTTLVDSGGNCFFTAKDPAGPWSEPVFFKEVDGIDPSFFFDDDGRAWLINNGPPPENHPLYDGHRAIWLQEFDVKTQQLKGPRTVIVNGGTSLEKKPIWIEGPHLYKHGAWYYLSCAEGGTSEDHSQVVFRSKSVTGPFEPWSGNPILTQRDLPSDRPDAVTCTGHADLVELTDGTWWSVFLGCQPYSERYYNTGRQTFLLPVQWTDDDWPVILPYGEAVPTLHVIPALSAKSALSHGIPTAGTFTQRDEFNGQALPPFWCTLRGPAENWYKLGGLEGTLVLTPRPETLSSKGVPSFVARRQQHAHFSAATALTPPITKGVSAGIVAFQNETHWFFFGVRRTDNGIQLFVERAASKMTLAKTEIIASAMLYSGDRLSLRISGAGRNYTFSYALDEDHWQPLASDVDGSILSTEEAGGFVGTMLGLHARLDPRKDTE